MLVFIRFADWIVQFNICVEVRGHEKTCFVISTYELTLNEGSLGIQRIIHPLAFMTASS